MDDMISRQIVINAIDTIESEVADGEGFQYEKWREYFENLPSAQPEIIRCKDCRKNPNWEWVGCPMTGKDTRKPDDFCSYAERREV